MVDLIDKKNTLNPHLIIFNNVNKKNDRAEKAIVKHQITKKSLNSDGKVIPGNGQKKVNYNETICLKKHLDLINRNDKLILETPILVPVENNPKSFDKNGIKKIISPSALNSINKKEKKLIKFEKGLSSKNIKNREISIINNYKVPFCNKNRRLLNINTSNLQLNQDITIDELQNNIQNLSIRNPNYLQFINMSNDKNNFSIINKRNLKFNNPLYNQMKSRKNQLFNKSIFSVFKNNICTNYINEKEIISEQNRINKQFNYTNFNNTERIIPSIEGKKKFNIPSFSNHLLSLI